jgi:hypothetical protein
MLNMPEALSISKALLLHAAKCCGSNTVCDAQAGLLMPVLHCNKQMTDVCAAVTWVSALALT